MNIFHWFSRHQKSLVLLSVTATFCLRFVDSNIVSISIVSGKSMQPSLNPLGTTTKDVVLLDRSPIWAPERLRRGDIVTYRTTRAPGEFNIKRIVGLPGDRVRTVGYKRKYVTIPDGHCWLEGDNVRHSDDSNKVGPIPMGLIKGRATRIILPYSRGAILERKLPLSRIDIRDEKELPDIANLPLINDTPFAISPL